MNENRRPAGGPRSRRRVLDHVLIPVTRPMAQAIRTPASLLPFAVPSIESEEPSRSRRRLPRQPYALDLIPSDDDMSDDSASDDDTCIQDVSIETPIYTISNHEPYLRFQSLDTPLNYSVNNGAVHFPDVDAEHYPKNDVISISSPEGDDIPHCHAFNHEGQPVQECCEESFPDEDIVYIRSSQIAHIPDCYASDTEDHLVQEGLRGSFANEKIIYISSLEDDEIPDHQASIDEGHHVTGSREESFSNDGVISIGSLEDDDIPDCHAPDTEDRHVQEGLQESFPNEEIIYISSSEDDDMPDCHASSNEGRHVQEGLNESSQNEDIIYISSSDDDDEQGSSHSVAAHRGKENVTPSRGLQKARSPSKPARKFGRIKDPRRSEKRLAAGLRPLSMIGCMFASFTASGFESGLDSFLKELNGRPLRVATMCSTAESSLLALQLLADQVKTHMKHDLAFKHVFCAETQDPKQTFIHQNCAPPIVFRNVREIQQALYNGSGEATTAQGCKVNIPVRFEVVVAGSFPVDRLSMKRRKKTRPGKADLGDAYHAILALCRQMKPLVVIIEDVKSAPWDDIRKDYEAAGYVAGGVFVDTKDFSIPPSRQRGYMFCINVQTAQETTTDFLFRYY